MKKRILLITLVIVFSTIVSSAKGSEDFSYMFGSTIWSKYVSSTGGECYKNPVIQSYIEVTHNPTGFYFEVWHSGESGHEIFNNENGGATEIDYTLGWIGKLGDLTGITTGNLDVKASMSYWDCGKLGGNKEEDTLYWKLQLSKFIRINKRHNITPFANIGLYNPYGIGNGTCIKLGMGHSWQLNYFASINTEVATILDSGIYNHDRGIIGFLETSLRMNLGKGLTLIIPSVKITTPLQSLKDDRKTEVVIGGGFEIKF